jgi:hypothetical protein
LIGVQEVKSAPAIYCINGRTECIDAKGDTITITAKMPSWSLQIDEPVKRECRRILISKITEMGGPFGWTIGNIEWTEELEPLHVRY